MPAAPAEAGITPTARSASPTPLAQQITATATVFISDPPTATPTLPPPPGTAQDDKENYLAELAAYRVEVGNSETVKTEELAVLYEAVYRLGQSALPLMGSGSMTLDKQHQAFTDLFGPTVIYIYSEADTLVELHYGFNCGWQGKQANGCQNKDLFPEQEFPEAAWLILFAGNPLLHGGDRIQGKWVVAHELAHNLTWGEGHKPTPLNYVTYASEKFAIDHFPAFGSQAGLHAYKDQTARDAHSLWRYELTADAIASWGLQDVIGPHAETVGAYLMDFMIQTVEEW